MNLARVLVNPGDAPKAVHQIMWTRVGRELEIAMGFFDLSELRLAIEAAKNMVTTSKPEEVAVEAKVYITDRFTMSTEVAARIYEELGKLIKDLRAEGLLPSEGVVSSIQSAEENGGSSH